MLSHVEIGRLDVPRQGYTDPLGLVEIETKLSVLRVLKGPPLRGDIRYRFYDSRGYAQVGPPRGPSGPVDSVGIFFLKRQPSGLLRSLVDVYRPEIATPWIAESVERGMCRTIPSQCIASILLEFQESDDQRMFALSLSENVAIARQLIGFLDTYNLLLRLVQDEQQFPAMEQAACSEMIQWYPLEISLECSRRVVDPAMKAELIQRTARLRERLTQFGLAWVRQHIGSDDPAKIMQYLTLLIQVGDKETREVALRLKEKLK